MAPIQTSIPIRRKSFLRFVEAIDKLDRAAANRRFYDQLWRHSRFITPDRFNTWPLVCQLAAKHRLEVGPGLRPRLPISGTHFLDLSPIAVAALSSRGGLAHCGDAATLPYPDQTFDLVSALDIIEHIEDEDAAIAELARVLRPRGTLLLAVPMHAEHWTTFDTVVGHARRYSRDQIVAALSRHGFTIERSAAYGMQSRSRRLCDFTALGFWRMPRVTIFIYNSLVMPLGLARQKPLKFHDGLLDTTTVEELLLVCRRS